MYVRGKRISKKRVYMTILSHIFVNIVTINCNTCIDKLSLCVHNVNLVQCTNTRVQIQIMQFLIICFVQSCTIK